MGESLPLNDFEVSQVTFEEKLNVEPSNLQERLHSAAETVRSGYNQMRDYLGNKFPDVLEKARGGFRLAAGAAAVSLMVACSSGKARAETPTPTPVVQTTPGAVDENSTPTVVNLGPRQSKAPTSSTTITSSKFVEPGGSVEEPSEEPTSVTAPTKGGTNDDTTPNSEVTVEENSQELNFKLPEKLPEGTVVIITEISGAEPLTFSPEDLTGGIDLGLEGLILEPEVGQNTHGIGHDIVKFLKTAGYTLSPEGEEKILAMRVDYGKSQQGDSGIYRFELPNEPVVISDEKGNSFIFNPYSNLSEDDLVLKPVSEDASPIKVKSATITDSSGNTTNLSFGDGVIDEPESTPVPEPKKLVITSGVQPASTGNPIAGSGASESESKLASSSTEVLEENIGNIDWESIEWEDDESFSVRIWLEDMIAKGYIKIDSAAERYAGDEIYRFKENFVIVPVPKNYFTTGSTYYDRVTDALENLESSSGGHIIVDPRAKASLPEGAELYVPGSVLK